MRAPGLMWLLGAGASAAAGIPTAGDMTWDFKQRLYVSQRRVDPASVADLSNGAVRRRLQDHIDGSGSYPKPGEPDEYAALFEMVYPAEADRQAYLHGKLTGASPSYGHLALATLMKAGLVRIVWTTNFDHLVADAAAQVYSSTAALTSVGLDAPHIGIDAVTAERWPIEVKLHGDFQSRRLKNTSDELRSQDALLLSLFVDCCRRYGLVVAGYSGRDDSVMDTLEETVRQESSGFPRGLYWLHRGDDPPLGRVEELLNSAVDAGVEVALVPIPTFDEALRDLVHQVGDLGDTAVLDSYAKTDRAWTGAPTPAGRRGWPAIRLNALPVTASPTVCRRVACSIGGYREVQQAIVQADVDVIGARVRAGVLAFGDDEAVRAAFGGFGIAEFDLHTIEVRRLRYDSGERGLLRDALARALTRERRLKHLRRRSSDLFYAADEGDPAWGPLRKAVGTLAGPVPGNPALRWAEGVGTRLDWADDRLWLLVEPRIVFEGLDESNRAAASDFARERTAQRYNSKLNDLLGFWAAFLAGDGGPLRALGVSEGVDATFELSGQTAFSRRFYG